MSSNVRVVLGHHLRHNLDGVLRSRLSVGRVDDTEHSLLAVFSNSTVVEGGLGIVDNLIEGEGLVLFAGSERSFFGRVAKVELRTFGDGVWSSSPNKSDSITNRGVDGEGNISENTLSWGNPDSVSGTAALSVVIVVGRI